MYVLNGHNNY